MICAEARMGNVSWFRYSRNMASDPQRQFAENHQPASQPDDYAEGKSEIQRHPGAVGALHPLGVKVLDTEFFGFAVCTWRARNPPRRKP